MTAPRSSYRPETDPAPGDDRRVPLALLADDRALVVRIRAGDEAAFADLFRRYYDALCRFAYAYVGTRARAQEVVQDVFCNVWQEHARWTVTRGVGQYLYGAVRNRAFRECRRERIEAQWLASAAHENEVLQRTACANDGAERLARGDIATVVRRTVASLPSRCREAFVLSRSHHLSNVEIAVAMGTTVKTVEIQIGKALHALRLELSALRG